MSATWLWTAPDDPAPVNRFHYFRKVFHLDELPDNTLLKFAADTNAQLWINGHPLRRKVSRYAEEKITAENVQAGPFLKKGLNTVVVLHHNWGPITCFMRTGNRHAGLHIESDWLVSDTSWKWIEAPQFTKHEYQVTGIHGGAHRVRFPVIMDVKRIPQNIFDADYNDADWHSVCEVECSPWPGTPLKLETPGQRETPVLPASVLAAGRAARDFSPSPEKIASGLKNAKLFPDSALKGAVAAFPFSLKGAGGESVYITFDFGLPVHGFPFVELEDSTSGICIDFGYGEIARTLYKGEALVDETGWINTERVVGSGYADRIIARSGFQNVEIPDERTARWMALHIYFPEGGTLKVKRAGMISSQYPVEYYGSFHCGNERIEQLVKLGLIHAEVTMSDAYIDTPGREDGQWVEDIRLRALIGASWFNDTLLRRFFIRTFADGEDAQGAFHPFYPSNFPASPGPVDWTVQWVCMVYDEYMWSGDTGSICANLEKMQRFWRWVAGRTNNDGLFVCGLLLADIRNDADCSETQSSGLVTAFLLERLAYSITMAQAIENSTWHDELNTLHTNLMDGFRKYHVVPATETIPAHVATRCETSEHAVDRGFHQAAQTTAVFAGLLTTEESEAVVDYAFADPDGSPSDGVKRWNNPTFAYRALRAMSHAGRPERAVRHLLERYAPYLPGHPRNSVEPTLQGPYGGPLPEYWISRADAGICDGEINPHQPDDETGSHGWGAVVLQWFHDTLLGVSITEPGGGRICIAPQTGGLPFVSGHTMTPKGGVYVYWDPQQHLIRVALPNGVEAELVLPPEIHEDRTCILRADGILQKDGPHCLLHGAGTYELLAW